MRTHRVLPRLSLLTHVGYPRVPPFFFFRSSYISICNMSREYTTTDITHADAGIMVYGDDRRHITVSFAIIDTHKIRTLFIIIFSHREPCAIPLRWLTTRVRFLRLREGYYTYTVYSGRAGLARAIDRRIQIPTSITIHLRSRFHVYYVLPPLPINSSNLHRATPECARDNNNNEKHGIRVFSACVSP